MQIRIQDFDSTSVDDIFLSRNQKKGEKDKSEEKQWDQMESKEQYSKD